MERILVDNEVRVNIEVREIRAGKYGSAER